MKPNAISQSDVHYYPPWSRPTELLVLLKLDRARIDGKWNPGDHEGNIAAIDSVCDELTGHPYLLHIPKHKYHEKVMEWWFRYVRFNALLKDDRTWYCEESKRVFCTDISWSQIEIENPSALCYMEEGEANWDILKRLFYEPEVYSCSDEDDW
ncbi:uncharacterized protein LOC131011950 [Salvia miltiorrhiza]|uniref:uncharacterized protein LOC131011950 n=1 Tax=Salvia miltiorrhiza TaxID=226208 RepID=UPI0025AC96E4|nr:uncharacterized protein LOC131011950 [Salvia miltiorrhiza]